ncbi:MAG TPA: hypothetical protein PLP33_19760 [Leptospiraceae bacterium]|jgi:hypothetical protein|nr:hypothetical protein [Leptospiraceae bacterium]
MTQQFRWTRNQSGQSSNGFASTESEAFTAALNAAPNALNASIKVFNAKSGIQVKHSTYRLGTVDGAIVKGWFPSIN